MRKIQFAILFLLSCLLITACAKKPEKVLIFSKTAAFRHSSIEKGITALTGIAASKGIQVKATEDASYITEDSLQQYGAVIFLNTSGDILNSHQQADFERYIQAGGGFLGIHAATDTEYHWPWYNRLVGAYFNGHPQIQKATLKVRKHEDPSCQHLSDTWSISDEWYNFKSINSDTVSYTHLTLPTKRIV